MTIREMASLGGKARAAKLTKAQRKAIGKKAIAARWEKTKKLVDEITEGTKALEKKARARAKAAKK
jgi:hypothetical protein